MHPRWTGWEEGIERGGQGSNAGSLIHQSVTGLLGLARSWLQDGSRQTLVVAWRHGPKDTCPWSSTQKDSETWGNAEEMAANPQKGYKGDPTLSASPAPPVS